MATMGGQSIGGPALENGRQVDFNRDSRDTHLA
jgi:hypothetical protein